MYAKVRRYEGIDETALGELAARIERSRFRA
jgi:hypothetical protein